MCYFMMFANICMLQSIWPYIPGITKFLCDIGRPEGTFCLLKQTEAIRLAFDLVQGGVGCRWLILAESSWVSKNSMVVKVYLSFLWLTSALYKSVPPKAEVFQLQECLWSQELPVSRYVPQRLLQNRGKELQLGFFLVDFPYRESSVLFFKPFILSTETNLGS